MNQGHLRFKDDAAKVFLPSRSPSQTAGLLPMVARVCCLPAFPGTGVATSRHERGFVHDANTGLVPDATTVYVCMYGDGASCNHRLCRRATGWNGQKSWGYSRASRPSKPERQTKTKPCDTSANKRLRSLLPFSAFRSQAHPVFSHPVYDLQRIHSVECCSLEWSPLHFQLESDPDPKKRSTLNHHNKYRATASYRSYSFLFFSIQVKLTLNQLC